MMMVCDDDGTYYIFSTVNSWRNEESLTGIQALKLRSKINGCRDYLHPL